MSTVKTIKPFADKLNFPLSKKTITVLQINLGRKCNLACNHCHVEASPKRTEELSPLVCEQLIQLIRRFPQIQMVDLTGGAPEMNYGFQDLVKAARESDKQVIVRSNLTIYFESGFDYLPEYFAKNKVKIVASLPCYLADNVDKMRGNGVFDASVKAIQWLNSLGYGTHKDLILDLVYNPQLPINYEFSLPPNQKKLEQDYKDFLKDKFDIVFNNLFAIANLPVGRTKLYLERRKLHQPYLQFLESNFNESTVEHLMCRNEISIDYLGNVYDCDFNQMMDIKATTPEKKYLTVASLLEADTLDQIEEVKTALYCYGCTAGSGSSCGGSLL